MREQGLAFVAVGKDRRGVLDTAQAFMALLEGYAEHVMDAVGADLLTDLDAMRGAMDRRRTERSGLLRLLEKLIGLDMKMRQYQQGKAFCDARRGPRRDRRPEPRVGRAGVRSRRPPSSTTRSAGWAGPSRSPPEPLRATGQLRLGRAARGGREVGSRVGVG